MSALMLLLASILVTASTLKVENDGSTKIAPVPMKDQDTDMQAMQRDSDLPDLIAVMNECNETFRIEMAFLEALNDSGTFPDETDKTPMCYMRCFLEKTGVASEEGQYDAARAATVFASERGGRTHQDLEDSASQCTQRSETCKCERAYNFMRCLVEKDIEKHEAPYKGEPEEDSK